MSMKLLKFVGRTKIEKNGRSFEFFLKLFKSEKEQEKKMCKKLLFYKNSAPHCTVEEGPN